MCDIILDSSIINRDRSFSGPDMKLLKRLSSLGLLQWHIPWVIYQEIITHNQTEGIKKIDKLGKHLDDLEKVGVVSTVTSKIRTIRDLISEVRTEFDCKIYWNTIFKEANAQIDTFNTKLSYDVMCSYFNGEAPFPEPKSRKDIPDAFIYEHIKEYASHKPVFFICGDNNLSIKCNNLNNVVVFSSLKDFYQSDEYKPIESKYKNIEQYNKGLKVISVNASQIISKAREDVYGDLLVDFNQGIENYNILSDEHEGILTGISNISKVEILFNDIKYVDNKFYIPISVIGDFVIEYFLYKADYPLYDDRKIRIIEDWNDHYYLVNEQFNASFIFNYSIDKTDIDNDNIELHMIEKIDELILKPIHS